MDKTRQICEHPPYFPQNAGKCNMDTDREISQSLLKQFTAFILKIT